MIDNVTDISIEDYLGRIGVATRKQGNRIFASSPFSRDTNWSFCIYPNTNSYFDFSTGHGGNILNLVSRLNKCSISEAAKHLKQGSYEKYKPNYKQCKEESKFWEEFNVEKYTNTDKKECIQIEEYAKKRGISFGYIKGIFFTRQEERWIRNPSIGFVHVNKNGIPCGIKFRKIKETKDVDQSPRFSARGVLGFYVLENLGTKSKFESPVLYVVESESSANSLWMYLKELNRPSVVISRGGVTSAPKLDELPEKYKYMNKKIIIDYDGNEKLYSERLKLYSDLNAEPIKLYLEKGEDLNSLYVNKKMDLITNLL